MTRTDSGYPFQKIEQKWQSYWLENQTFRAEENSVKPKYYVLDMFPYPSGKGLHVGHPLGYIASDIMARYMRMKGYNVLHPIGWDAFGLPAEQHAIRTGTHPNITTEQNITHFKQQLLALGLSFDWQREINTTDPKYYRWTQWIFLKLFEQGLAYQAYEPVNWCPKLGTVLANEEVVDGKSEIGNFPVEKRLMRQWVLKITDYAERLLQDLELVEWPESIKRMQRNWIGKSHGADITIEVADCDNYFFEIFTTRPDTLFGVTFFLLAPEHPIITKIVTEDKKSDIEAYRKTVSHRSDMERTALTKGKTGVFTGSYAINPANGKRCPIYIAEYVLSTYGHGAIMAVPAHDERDYEFAKNFDLPIRQVIISENINIHNSAYSGDGKLINSDFLNGLDRQEAIREIIRWLEKKNLGKGTITYKLRDWLFSRQRYWGEPFPILYDKDDRVVPCSEDDLPVILPDLLDFKPSPGAQSPLTKAKDWINFKTPEGVAYRREDNTMPQWAGSCWYYLRYLDPNNNQEPWSAAKERYWLPVDLYVGGGEHAVLHLLYARFWHKVLYDLGYVSSPEPFRKLVNQGMILGKNGEKMSKSRGNTLNPDDIIAEWGADSFRLYEMFMGPLTTSKPWQENGIAGCYRFLKRLWCYFFEKEGELSKKIAVQSSSVSQSLLKSFNKLIKKVTEDTESMHYNTAIAAMMGFVNELYKPTEIGLSRAMAEKFILVLAPYVPHFAEEVWACFGYSQTISYHAYPAYDGQLLIDDFVTLSVQVNGKHRASIIIHKSATKIEVSTRAKLEQKVIQYLEQATIAKEMFVPDRMINFVLDKSSF